MPEGRPGAIFLDIEGTVIQTDKIEGRVRAPGKLRVQGPGST